MTNYDYTGMFIEDPPGSGMYREDKKFRRRPSVEKSYRIIRPRWDKLVSILSGNVVACSCGAMLPTFADIRDHWQWGHFDYVEDESLLDELLDALMQIRNIVQVAFVAGGWTALETEEMEEIVQIANTAIARARVE